MSETGWVLQYYDDLESDFSALHRVSDMESLSARKFFNFAERMVYYKGTIRGRAEAEAEENQKHTGVNAPGAPSSGGEKKMSSSEWASRRSAAKVDKVTGNAHSEDIAQNPDIAGLMERG